MERLLVLGLLMEQVLGQSRAWKTDSLEFTFLFYCVTLGKLPTLSVLQFPRGFTFRICFNAVSCVPGTLCLGLSWMIDLIELSMLSAVDTIIIPVSRMREPQAGSCSQ